MPPSIAASDTKGHSELYLSALEAQQLCSLWASWNRYPTPWNPVGGQVAYFEKVRVDPNKGNPNIDPIMLLSLT